MRANGRDDGGGGDEPQDVGRARAGHDDDGQPDRQQDDGGAEVGLGEDEHRRHEGDGKRRDKDGELADALLAVGQVLGEDDHEDELRQLRRLHLRAGELDPASRAVDGLAGDEHERQGAPGLPT